MGPKSANFQKVVRLRENDSQSRESLLVAVSMKFRKLDSHSSVQLLANLIFFAFTDNRKSKCQPNCFADQRFASGTIRLFWELKGTTYGADARVVSVSLLRNRLCKQIAYIVELLGTLDIID